MKAVIYNSGLGKRMGELTKNRCKSMVKLSNGETIFERQLRLLQKAGIKDFVITTGPFEELLKNTTKQKKFQNLNFTFVKNPIYDKTNYIYSMYLAKDYLNDDVLMLHGDLVFNYKLIKDILHDKRQNLATTNHQKKLPEKDFKARVIDGKIKEVSISIFDENCYSFQPLYKLTKDNIEKWLNNVEKFVNSNNTNVYAENAFNEISDYIPIDEFSYEDYYIDEIDNAEDLKRVSEEIRYFDFREQNIITSTNYKAEIQKLTQSKRILIVTRNFFENSKLKKYLDEINATYFLFKDFSPNPLYNDVVNGVKLFLEKNCDYIISYGGGSAIDVAKCIKIFSSLSTEKSYLDQELIYNDIEHLAIPTTSGTGSESTRFAVVYENNTKISITHDTLLPNNVILDYTILKTLPDYQKKSPVLDALCQAIESYWSVKSTSESKKYAQTSLTIILNNIKGYLNNEDQALEKIQQASNLSGKAINISETTAAHAMSYKITSLYKVAHGHAVALCLPTIIRYMSKNIDKCNDPRGITYLESTFKELCNIFQVQSLEDIADYIDNLIENMELDRLTLKNTTDLELLTKSVNETRLKNNPITITDDIKNLYQEIFNI